ncbi:MAG: MGMT family protein [Paenibacillaceae bacterium]|nr:MGMT family protein [Paenibacillaceae bacterium]
MQPFTEEVIAIIRAIPAGKVMTYGQIAELAGSRRAARQVVRVLHAMSRSHGLPWHRVLNAHGKIGERDGESMMRQIEHLEAEGVEVSARGEIDLVVYQYWPPPESPV